MPSDWRISRKTIGSRNMTSSKVKKPTYDTIGIRTGHRLELDIQFRAILAQRVGPGESVSRFIKRAVVEWAGGVVVPVQDTNLEKQFRELSKRLWELEKQVQNKPLPEKGFANIPGERTKEAQQLVKNLMSSFK
jgi:hypothetical protein